MERRFEKLLVGVMLFLIAYTPLAYGSILPYGFKVIEASSFALLSLWSLRALRRGRFSIVRTPLLYFLPITAAFFILQALPLPAGVVEASSRGRAMLRAYAGLAGGYDTLGAVPWLVREQGLYLFSVLVLFFIVINHIRSEKGIRLVITSALAMGGVLAVLLFLQRVVYKWGTYLPYINKNHFAGYMEVLIPVGFSAAVLELSGMRTGHGLKDKVISAFSGSRGSKAVVAGFFTAFLLTGLLMARSRGAVIGFLVSLCVMAAMFVRSRKGLAGFALMGIVLLYLGLSWAGSEQVYRYMSRLANISENSSDQLRRQIWNESSEMIHDFPAFGVGLGGYETVSPVYRTSELEDYNVHQPDSDVLYTLAEGGALGLLLAAAFWATLLWLILRRYAGRRDSFVRRVCIGSVGGLAALTVHGVIDTNFHMPANLLLITVMMALAYVCVNTSFKGRTKPDGAGLYRVAVELAGTRRYLTAGVAAVSALLAFYALAGVAASVVYRSTIGDDERIYSSQRPDKEDFTGALARLSLASRLDPGCSYYSFEAGRIYLTLAEYYEKTGQDGKDPARPPREYYELAASEFRKSLYHNPYSSFGHLLLGRALEHGLDEKDAGEKEYMVAERLNPSSPLVRRYIAEYYKATLALPPASPAAAASTTPGTPTAHAEGVTPEALTVSGLVPEGGSYSAKPGDKVKWKAVAGPAGGGLEYRFRAWRYDKGWAADRPYSPDGRWTWDTTYAKPGGYRIMVWVRRAGESGPGEKAAAGRPFVIEDR